jgi:hypothetical protein
MSRATHEDPLCGCYADSPHTCGPGKCRGCVEDSYDPERDDFADPTNTPIDYEELQR